MRAKQEICLDTALPLWGVLLTPSENALLAACLKRHALARKKAEAKRLWASLS